MSARRRRRGGRSAALVGALLLSGSARLPAQEAPSDYRSRAEGIIEAALSDSTGWDRLAELVDSFGPRFSGTLNLELAIDWIVARMQEDGLQNVRGEPIMVPRWVRGSESLAMVSPRRRQLPMLGLGGSVGTPRGGVHAEVMVVESFEELELRTEEARGRIVLFDAPFVSYGQTVRYRSQGAIAAARAGAVASLIRSVTPFSMQTPHTGGMAYEEGVPRIPHAAITPDDASLIHRLVERGERVEVHLTMDAQTLPDAPSRNVVAELVGRESPEEVVVLGGHIDSWDVGQGAMDDGGGSVAAWEAVRLLTKLGLRPRRTVRVVLWTNEENGLRGGTGYAEQHAAEVDGHVLAMESDGGVFRPLGFGFTGSDAAYQVVSQVGELLEGIGSGRITRGGGGADIGPLMQRGVPGMGLAVEGERYFWYHHTDADTLDKLDPEEFALCVATMAVMAYVVADLPERLPR